MCHISSPETGSTLLLQVASSHQLNKLPKRRLRGVEGASTTKLLKSDDLKDGADVRAEGLLLLCPLLSLCLLLRHLFPSRPAVIAKVK